MEETAQLRVGSHVLIQLGRELVTDVEQAILECVKNSYDADSPGCRIEIDTREQGTLYEHGTAGRLARFTAPAENVDVLVTPSEGADEPAGGDDPTALVTRQLDYIGRITIEDTGDGMDPDQLRSSWLVISKSRKRTADGPKAKTPRGRTPLGDKGLGRLGTMKLGDILMIESATSPESVLWRAQFRWADCDIADTVDQIPVQISNEANSARFKGTRVSILGLNDMPEWRRSKRLNEITRSLAQLISPFEATSTFPVGIVLDGVDQSLSGLANEVLARAVAEFHFRWEDDPQTGNRRLVARARMRKRLLASERNENQKRKTERAFNGPDRGEGFAKALKSSGRMKQYDKVEVFDDAPWYLEIERTFNWSDFFIEEGLASTRDPGPFTGSFYYFHLNDRGPDEAAAAGVGVDSATIKSMAGISILRDGFKVRSPGDWLGLSSGMTSGSTYGLRVDNTVGYFALTGAENFGLVEKSDREGFVEDATYRGFHTIAQRCQRFASEAMENTRRTLDKYVKDLDDRDAIQEGASLDPLADISSNLQSAQHVKDVADKAASDLDRSIKEIEGGLDSGVDVVNETMKVMKATMAAIDEVRSKIVPPGGSDAALKRLKRDMDDKQQQMVGLFESAAVGLSARGLAHELRTHLAEIRQRANAIEKSTKGSSGHQSILPDLRAIRASCSAISGAASLIDPMLPRSRATKDTFSLGDFVGEYFENRRLSLEKSEITVEVVLPPEPTVVRMNRSRLLQVLDNLVRNSAYWLRRASTSGPRPVDRNITVQIDGRGFVLFDGGEGVDPHVEESLFEMFVTTKPEGDPGQGLGLFIISELLALDACTISLGTERNPSGRRFKFDVDLHAVLFTGDRK
jgi:signal transduction histidine kinase